DPGDLLTEKRLPDVCAEVADPGYLPELLADAQRRTLHLLRRGSRLADPVHQEVTFLERREERLTEQRRYHDPRHADQPEDGVRPSRPDDDPRQRGGVPALQHRHHRGLPTLDPGP